MNRFYKSNDKNNYIAPLVEILNIAAERGYIGSLESPEPDGEL